MKKGLSIIVMLLGCVSALMAQDMTYEELIAHAEANSQDANVWKADLDQALKLQPNKPDAYYSYYYLLKDQKPDSARAVGLLLKGIKFDKLAPRKTYYQGVFSIDHRNKPDSAIFFFDKAMAALKEKDPAKKKCAIYFGMAKAHYKKNDAKTAREKVAAWMKLMENLNCEECIGELSSLASLCAQEETRLKSPDFAVKMFFKESACNEAILRLGGFNASMDLLNSLSLTKNPASLKLSWALISKAYAYVFYSQEFKNLEVKDEERIGIYQSFFTVAPVFEKDENQTGENISVDVLYNAFPEQVTALAVYLNGKGEPEKAMEVLEKSADLPQMKTAGDYYYERAKTRKMMAGDASEICADYKKSKELKFKPTKDELKAVCK